MEPSPFTFRLERVRALREREEELAKEQFAASLHHRIEGEALVRSALAELDGARSAQRDTATAGAPSGLDLVFAQAYLERAERLRRAAELDLDRRDADVADRRSALTFAAQERQVLERLKSRRRAEHGRETARREGAALDEIALGMHRRRAA